MDLREKIRLGGQLGDVVVIQFGYKWRPCREAHREERTVLSVIVNKAASPGNYGRRKWFFFSPFLLLNLFHVSPHRAESVMRLMFCNKLETLVPSILMTLDPEN